MQVKLGKSGSLPMNRRRFLGATAAGVLAANLKAARAQSVEPVRGGILRAGMGGGASTDTLDPALAANQVADMWNLQWGEQLVQLNPDGTLDPALAEEWSSSADARTWSFKIRKGITFHDGSPLTPADVEATLQRHADKNSTSGALALFSDVESIRADGDTLKVELSSPNVEFPYILTDYHLVIQPGGGRGNPSAGIGTGPYRVELFEPGVRILGTRNENYWRTDRGFADEIQVLVINDTNARISAIRAGQVDMINLVNPRVVRFIESDSNVVLKNVAGKGHYVFIMRSDVAPFTNKDVRLALKYAINREDMLQRILGGYGQVGNDFPINASYHLFQPLAQRPFDLERAAFHYRRSGHSGPIVLQTSEAAFNGAIDAAELFRENAAQAGIEIVVQREPADGYWSNVWNVQPFCASYWSGRATQDQMYTTAYYSQANWNESRFQNPEFDALLLQARSEADEAARGRHYRRMAQLVHEEGGTIVPFFNEYMHAIRSNVAGWIDDGNWEMMGGYAMSKCWLST